MAFVPEREREQPPQLTRQVLPPGDVRVQDARDDLRAEEPLPREHRLRQRLPRKGLELAAQPRGRGDREAALASVHDPARQQRLDRTPQQDLLPEPLHLRPLGQREREPRDERVEVGHTRLERVGHRGPVGLHEQVVDEIDAEVDVLETREQLRPLRLPEARAVQIDRVERALPPGQLGPRVCREDLLPRVMPLERRQLSRPHEPLGAVVEARARRRAREQLDERARERGRPAHALGQPIRHVRVVAAEELVAALARQGDLHVLRRELRDEVGRQSRRVRERLVERLRERRQEQRGMRTQHELPVLRPVPLRDEPRVTELVEGALLEADRERPQRLRALLGRERGERRRIDSAREQHPDRHVRDEMRAYRVPQPRAKLLGEEHRVLAAHVACRDRRRPREPLEPRLAPLPDEQMSGRKLPRAAEDRERRRDRVEGEERLERIEVDFASGQRAQLGGERQADALRSVVERLDPEAVARQDEPTLPTIPDRDSEHAPQPLGKSVAQLLVEVHEHLRVALRAEPMARALQLGAQLPVVVELAVLDDVHGAVLVRERLVAGLEVDDREPPRRQPDRAVKD